MVVDLCSKYDRISFQRLKQWVLLGTVFLVMKAYLALKEIQFKEKLNQKSRNRMY